MTKENKKISDDHEERPQHCPYLLQVSQKAVIYNPKDGTFLLVKDVDEKNFFSVHFGPWELVGGRLQKGESIRECLQREVREEIGDIKYEIVSALGAADIEYRTGKAIAIGHLLFYKGGEIKLSQEHSEFRWASWKEIEESQEYKPWVKNLIKGAVQCLKEKEYLDGWKRCQADFENYKKRQAENQRELAKYSCQSVILEILPVLDNFYASTEHIPEDQKENPWVIGIMHIQKQLEKALTDNGVSEIIINEGDSFDPSMMEAIQQEARSDLSAGEAGNKEENGDKVKKVLAKGYKIDGKVIRAARVTVK